MVVYEGYAMGAKFQSHQLGELGGTLRLLCWRMGFPMMIVPPLTLRKLFVPVWKKAHPRASKKIKAAIKLENKRLMPVALERLFGYAIPQSDEADAAALMFAGECRFGTRQDAVVHTELDLSSLLNCEILHPRVGHAVGNRLQK